MIFPWFSHSKTPHSHYALPSLIPGSYFFEVFPKTFQDISSWRACVPTQDTQDRKLSCRRRFPSLPWEETLRCPPTLVKIQKTMEHHHLYIGKSTINGPFSIAVLNYQRVINPLGLVHWNFLCRSLQLWIYIYNMCSLCFFKSPAIHLVILYHAYFTPLLWSQREWGAITWYP